MSVVADIANIPCRSAASGGKPAVEGFHIGTHPVEVPLLAIQMSPHCWPLGQSSETPSQNWVQLAAPPCVKDAQMPWYVPGAGPQAVPSGDVHACPSAAGSPAGAHSPQPVVAVRP